MKLSSCAATLACLAAVATASAAPPEAGGTAGERPTPIYAAAATLDPQTQVARYTTLSLRPTEADENPLAVVAKVHFPRQVVKNVGDAVRYLLIRTGYQLAAADTLDSRVNAVLTLPLPDNQRALGPYRVDSMLAVLMGKPYQLVADPMARTVAYTVPTSVNAVPPQAAVSAAPSSAPDAPGRNAAIARPVSH